MQRHILETPAEAGEYAARLMVAEAERAVAERGQFTMALSGGRTPRPLLEALARQPLDWRRVQVLQVDERVAALDSGQRNFPQLQAYLLHHVPLPIENIHAMPVEDADLALAARSYAGLVQRLAGMPPRIDVVHLGLGDDGHTASLVPGDRVLQVDDADVALVGRYQGLERMTLTFPVLNAARLVVFFVTGSGKRRMVERLLAGDRKIPAGCVRQERAVLVADRAAMDG